MAVSSTKTTPFGMGPSDFFNDPTSTKIRRAFSPTERVRGVGSSLKFSLGNPIGIATSLFLVGSGTFSVPRLAYEETVGYTAGAMGWHLGSAAGRSAGRAAGNIAGGVERGTRTLGTLAGKRLANWKTIQKAKGMGQAARTTQLGQGIVGGLRTLGKSPIKAGITAAKVGTLLGGVTGALGLYLAASTMYDVAVPAAKKAIEYGRKMRRLETGRGFEDPFGTAYTMRQRSLMEMQRSHLNARSALGNEAYYGHVR